MNDAKREGEHGMVESNSTKESPQPVLGGECPSNLHPHTLQTTSSQQFFLLPDPRFDGTDILQILLQTGLKPRNQLEPQTRPLTKGMHSLERLVKHVQKSNRSLDVLSGSNNITKERI